jgi:hypothetical protein
VTSTADKPTHQREERTRVFCHLPQDSRGNEYRIVVDLINFLEGMRGKNVNLRGYTKTVEFPPVMEGFWRNSTRKQFLKEDVVLFIIDFDCTIRDDQLWETIAEIKQFLKDRYLFHTGKSQDEIWIVAHSVFRLV